MIRRLTVAAAIVAASVVVPGPVVDGYAGQCPRYEPAMRLYTPRGGWDINRMSYIAWRESRCIPTIVNRTGNDTGLFQAHPVTWPWLSMKFGIPYWRVQTWLKDPTNNVRAAAAMCTFWRQAGRGCYWAWTVTR